jgi:regulator of cell morphogenesis and NO signaling
MTTLESNTISEIAATSLFAVRVFEKYGIDYCCGGKRPVREACEELGLPAEPLLAELQAAIDGRPPDETDWTQAPLRDLIRHIVGTHHEYLKLELPRIAQRLAKVMRVYGQQDAETLAALPDVFGGLKAELEEHLHKEEVILFPYVERYEAAVQAGGSVPPVPFGSVANPIRMMEHEHDNAGEALRKLRASTRDYTVPAHACITYRSLIEGLRELEQDLHQHIHLENNILFPRAIALESEARDGVPAAR